MRASRVEVRPEREGHDRHEDEEEHRADRRAAADAPGDAPFAREQAPGRPAHAAAPVAGASPRSKRRGVVEPERRMGRGDDEAAAGEVLAHDAGEQPLRRDVERRRRLVEQPERARRDEQPRQRDAALLAGGERAHRKIGDMGEAEPLERAATSRRVDESPPSAPAQNARFSPAVSAPFSASAWPR